VDFVQRGVKEPSPLGTTVYFGLRSLDPLLQYGILARGWGSSLLHKIGFSTLPAGLPTNTGTIIDKLGLSPYRLILLAMATGSCLKQIYWLVGTSEEKFGPGAAVAVAGYNMTFNTLNHLLFTTTAFSASLSGNETFPQTPLIVGSIMYVVGILTEAVAEYQRMRFKRNPKNKGKPYTGGLWQYARHINYTGYSLWRAGYSLAAGGWIWGAAAFAWQYTDFVMRAVPVLNEYCEKKVSFVGPTQRAGLLTWFAVR
jgi:protein-S-isoprenylcysteine O-methyltransferase Ste14